MSFRRYLAAPASFGFTLGLAIVALRLENWSLEVFPWIALLAWLGALVLTGVSLKIGWPGFHVGASGLLMVAAAWLVATSYWPLPLAAAVATIALGRFAAVGFASRWLTRLIGGGALAGIGLLIGPSIGAGTVLKAVPSGTVALAGAIAALALIAFLGFWHGSDED